MLYTIVDAYLVTTHARYLKHKYFSYTSTLAQSVSLSC